jgi:EpsI family protein
MFWRTSCLGVLLAVTAVYVAGLDAVTPTPLLKPLAALPWEFDGWRGRTMPEMSQAVAVELASQEQVHRVYVDASGATVGLFIAYYGSQRQREAIHSPLNCLPGAGWHPLDRRRVPLGFVAGEALRSQVASGKPDSEVNRVLIAKGADRQLVFYWYQGRGRVIANEYWSKFFTVADAVRTRRTDAALVRVSGAIDSKGSPSEQVVESRLVAFTSALLPLLKDHLPD